MAHVYSHLHNLPTTGLRFFTVYGPWGRPDMSYFIFTSKIIKGEEIKIYNNGEMYRDFTYIDDVVDGIVRLLDKYPCNNSSLDHLNPKPSQSWAPFKIFNIGNSKPVHLMEFINIIEDNLGMKAKKEFMPIQPGDVEKTCADIEKISKLVEFVPKTNLKEGIPKFINWYKNFYC